MVEPSPQAGAIKLREASSSTEMFTPRAEAFSEINFNPARRRSASAGVTGLRDVIFLRTLRTILLLFLIWFVGACERVKKFLFHVLGFRRGGCKQVVFFFGVIGEGLQLKLIGEIFIAEVMDQLEFTFYQGDRSSFQGGEG